MLFLLQLLVICNLARLVVLVCVLACQYFPLQAVSNVCLLNREVFLSVFLGCPHVMGNILTISHQSQYLHDLLTLMI